MLGKPSTTWRSQKVTLFLLALLFIARPQMALGQTQRIVNVAVYGPFTDKEAGQRVPYAPERYVSRVAGSVRAFQDVNNRDGTIIPDLARPQSECNIKYQYHLVDSVSSFGTAIQQYFHLRGELEKLGQTVDAIVGPARSSVAVGLSTVASVYDVPMISYSATSPELDDQGRNPTFMRTIASDDAVASSITSLIQGFGYKEVNLIYVEDSYGKAYKDSLLKYFEASGIGLNVFPHRRTDKASIVNSLRRMKAKALNINIAIVFLEDLDTLLLEANRQEMTGKGTNWIFSDSIGSASDIRTMLAKASESDARVLKHALNGTTQVVVSGNVETVARYGSFQAAWRNGLVDLTELNSLLPGGERSNDFEESYQYPHVITEEFFRDKEISNFASFAYDAALAIVMGIEKQCVDGTLPENFDGKMFITHNIEFMGVSGDRVGFLSETGARDPATVYFVGNNIMVGDDGEVSFVTNNSVWLPFNESWMVSEDYKFSGGTTEVPLFTDPVDQEYNRVDPATRIGVFTVVALIEFMYFCLVVWVVKNRKKPVLSASQPLFLLISLLGVMLTLAMSFFFGWDETYLDETTLSIFCNLQWWGISLGVTISVCALLVKLYRINKLFAKKNNFRKVRVTSTKMLLVIALVLCVNIFLLGLWTGLDPFEYIRVEVKIDRFSQVQESFGICASASGSHFIYPVLVFHVLQYVVGGILAYKARNYSSDFQETKWITLAVFSQGQLFLVTVPLFLSIAASATTVFFVSICLTLCVFTLALVVMIFVPKIVRLYFGEEEVKTATKQEERLSRRMASASLGPTTASSLQKRLTSARYSSDMRSTTADHSFNGNLSFKGTNSWRQLPTPLEGSGGFSSRSIPETAIPITSSKLRLQGLRFRRTTTRFSVGTQTEDSREMSADCTIEEGSFESGQSKSTDAEKECKVTSDLASSSQPTTATNSGNSEGEGSSRVLPLSQT